MQGLDICARYFKEIGQPRLAAYFAADLNRMAIGLVGDGSDCFGFDDEISRDHDWGPAFCIWLTADDYDRIGASLSAHLDKLPLRYTEFERRPTNAWGQKRTGVFEVGQFYKQFIGTDQPPVTPAQWRLIPETHLAVATNGRIFSDPLGVFSAFREALLAFYPEDIRLKLIALRCMTMAQSGQYNYQRCIKRNEWVAAQRAEAQFIDAAISMVFLLNRRYKPFYKWMHRALKALPLLGASIGRLTNQMVTCHERHYGPAVARQKSFLVAQICARVITALRDQNLSTSASESLLEHGPYVQARIRDRQLRSLDIWAP